MSFRGAGFLIALVAAIAGVLAPASAAPAQAAAPGLTIVSDATYVVEQQVYADPGPSGLIGRLSMHCSGFVREADEG